MVGRDVQRAVSREQSKTALANVQFAGMQVNELPTARACARRRRWTTRNIPPRSARDTVAAVQAELAKLRGE